MTQNDQSDKFARLRQLAEEELMSLPRKLAGLSPDQQTLVLEEMLTHKPHVFQLVHELQVHQVELEMQHHELQQTQEALRQERARYAELYHAAPVGYLTTTQDGTIIEVNTTGARLLGSDALELRDQSLTHWIVPDDQDIYYFHLHYLADTAHVQTCELRIKQQNAPPMTVRLESTGITNADGEMQCRTVVLDVSERVRAEQALQQLNEELEQRVEERTAELREANKALHQEREEQRRLADENARLYHAEQRERARAEAAAARITQLQRVTALLSEAHTPDDVYSVMVREGITATSAYAGGIALLHDDGITVELMHQQDYPPHLIEQWQRYPITAPSPIAVCIRTGELLCIETRAALYADYPAFEVAEQSCAWANVPLVLDTHIRGCLFMSFAKERQFDEDDRALLRNLGQQGGQALERAELYAAERQARRVAEDAIRMRDQMFRMISHDLRGPLSGIQGYVYLTRKRLNNLEQSDSQQLTSGLEHIEQATQRMDRQIQELLDAATVHVGQPLSLSYGTFDLIALLRRAIDLNQSTSTEHTLQLYTDIASLMIIGDEMRLARVFDNLLNNAIKYSPDGGDIRMTVTQSDIKTRRGVSIAVQDQGIGMPASALEIIFEPFRRLSPPDKEIGGTGLGLASARQVVTQHDGTIDVASEEGRGSTFTVWLPVHTDT